jgi:uncharacterized membrane protein
MCKLKSEVVELPEIKELLTKVDDPKTKELLIDYFHEQTFNHNHNYTVSVLPSLKEVGQLESKISGSSDKVFDIVIMQLKNQKDIQNKEHEIEKEEIRLVETISKNNKETLEYANNKGFYIVIMVFLLVIFLFYKEEYSFGVALVSISGALGAIINAFNKKENNTIKKEDNIEE